MLEKKNYLEYIVGRVQNKIWRWYVSQRILWKEALHGIVEMTKVKILLNFPELMMQFHGKTYQVRKVQCSGTISIQVLLYPLCTRYCHVRLLNALHCLFFLLCNLKIECREQNMQIPFIKTSLHNQLLCYLLPIKYGI